MIDQLQGSMIAIHGPPKVGKTQLASKFPGAVHWIATEYGHKFLPEDQKKNLKNLDPDNGWATLRDHIKTLKPRGGKTQVLDTISGAYKLCMNFVCEKNGWSHPADAPHGKGWNAVANEFYDGISRLVHLTHSHNMTLIMIDHSKETLVETTTGNTEKVGFAMPGQARGIILPVPDHMWFLGYAEKDPNDALKSYTSQRALFISGNAKIEAGCRDPKVKCEVIMPLSKKDPYNQILHKLYGEQ